MLIVGAVVFVLAVAGVAYSQASDQYGHRISWVSARAAGLAAVIMLMSRRAPRDTFGRVLRTVICVAGAAFFVALGVYSGTIIPLGLLAAIVALSLLVAGVLPWLSGKNLKKAG